MKKTILVCLLMLLGGCEGYYETPEEYQRNLESFRIFNDWNRQQQEFNRNSQMDYQMRQMQMDIWRLRH